MSLNSISKLQENAGLVEDDRYSVKNYGLLSCLQHRNRNFYIWFAAQEWISSFHILLIAQGPPQESIELSKPPTALHSVFLSFSTTWIKLQLTVGRHCCDFLSTSSMQWQKPSHAALWQAAVSPQTDVTCCQSKEIQWRKGNTHCSRTQQLQEKRSVPGCITHVPSYCHSDIFDFCSTLNIYCFLWLHTNSTRGQFEPESNIFQLRTSSLVSRIKKGSEACFHA